MNNKPEFCSSSVSISFIPMSDHQIFPKEIIDRCIEVQRHRNHKKSKMIYLVLLFATLFLLSLTPFIYVDLYAVYPGKIRSKIPNNQILAPIHGKITEVYFENNQFINQGELLFEFDMTVVNRQIQSCQQNKDSLSLFIRDLEMLLTQNNISKDLLASNLYKREFIYHHLKLIDYNRHYQEKNSTYKRKLLLYQKGVIAKTDYQKSKFALSYAKDQIRLYLNKQEKEWQVRLHDVKSQLERLNTQLVELKKQKELHYVHAAVSGIIRHVHPPFKDNTVVMGSQIASISPDSGLIVECYVSSSDIGVLNKQSPVSYRVDSFNHHYWGTATGQVIEVEPEVAELGNLTVFNVLCSLNENELFLNNKKRGQLRSGMTLQAQFFIANRSVFQLLFDKMDDWYI